MMSLDEKELKKLLNREKVEEVSILKYGLFITTEDKEIEITADNDEVKVEIKNREFIE
ncbi:hypothetical protein ACDN41_12435 [Priestia aryabhattai]|uniref:hypothetical protein n=1 Tax=Priestia aryabhattai TaxID=412384 RepID=UPI003531A052